MDKIIFLENEDQQVDHCSGQKYYDFLDYAFSRTDFFMLVYVNYYRKGYSSIMKSFREKLKPFEVKKRTNPSWPGTLGTVVPNTTFKIIFYRNCDEAKKILKTVEKMSDWTRPTHPQDLAFFKGNQCWFYSVGHERIAAIIHADEKDLDFVEKNGLALRENAYNHSDDYYEAYNETLICSEKESKHNEIIDLNTHININYENRHKINNLICGSYWFAGYNYDYDNYLLSMNCLNSELNNEIFLCFHHTIFCSMQNCLFESGADIFHRIDLKENSEEFDRLLEINDELKDKFTQLNKEMKFLQLSIHTDSGAELFIICKSVNYIEN